jgi:glutathione S-transferase
VVQVDLWRPRALWPAALYNRAMNELLALAYSPWSEKARWALDVRGVSYRYRHYQPLLGELELRLKTRRLRGAVTVPVLTDGHGRVYEDSEKIARFADTQGAGPALFPSGQDAAIARWVALSERGLAAGRVLALERQLRDDEALSEMVPRGMQRPLGRLAARLGEFGVRRTLRKYGAGEQSSAQYRRTLRAVLEELRAALAGSTNTPKTLLGSFSFAEIAAAQILGFVSPPSVGLKLGPASARGFTDPELAREFADVVAWRDTLYAAYRLP